MKTNTRIALFLALGSCLLPFCLAGCSQSGSSSMTPQQKADFGKAGEPMPADAQKFMQQHGQGKPGGPPPAATTPK